MRSRVRSHHRLRRRRRHPRSTLASVDALDACEFARAFVDRREHTSIDVASLALSRRTRARSEAHAFPSLRSFDVTQHSVDVVDVVVVVVTRAGD